MFDGLHFHQGYVTRDIHKAVDFMSRLYGMTFTYLPIPDATESPEAVADVNVKIALGWHGNLEIELIEPIAGKVDFYREALAADFAPRLHHTGVLVQDWRRLKTDIAARGVPVVLAGELGDINFAYVDLRAELGHYVEYMWMSDSYRAWRWQGAKGC